MTSINTSVHRGGRMTVLEQLRKLHSDYSTVVIDTKTFSDSTRALLQFNKLHPPLLISATTDVRRLMSAKPGPHFERQAVELVNSISQALKNSHGISL